MKNTMKNNTILKALTGILFVSVLAVGGFAITSAIAPVAHAQEVGDGGDGGCDCGGGGSDAYGVDYSYAPSSGSDAYGVDYSYAPDQYGTSSYSPSDYSTSGYGTSGYSTSGYSTGGYSAGSNSYMVPVYQAPNNVYSTPSNVYAPTNTNTFDNGNTYAPTTVTDTTTTNNNTCTGNSCNTDDHSVVNITNPSPVINNVVANYGGSVANTQYCAQGYYGTYPNCYLNNNYQQPVVYQQPVAYAATPYVSLSQVPYTGLDLGFWGTIAYWGAFVLFALVVAYLVAIKRVQNVIARKLKNFLFGSADSHDKVAVVTSAPAKVAYAKVQTSEDVIDSFILTQVNRPRHA